MLNRSLTLAFAAFMAFSMPAFSEARLDLLGNPAPSNAATRTIVITPDTKWVNAEGGEIINFVVGDKSFGWDFYIGTGITTFDLRRVAPPGILDRRIDVYLTTDPKYRGRL